MDIICVLIGTSVCTFCELLYYVFAKKLNQVEWNVMIPFWFHCLNERLGATNMTKCTPFCAMVRFLLAYACSTISFASFKHLIVVNGVKYLFQAPN
jgi:hypothetical protein